MPVSELSVISVGIPAFLRSCMFFLAELATLYQGLRLSETFKELDNVYFIKEFEYPFWKRRSVQVGLRQQQ